MQYRLCGHGGAVGTGEVRPGSGDGDLRAREDDGLVDVREHEGERSAAESHGVGAVQHDEGVPVVVRGVDILSDPEPVLADHVAAVDQGIVLFDGVQLRIVRVSRGSVASTLCLPSALRTR